MRLIVRVRVLGTVLLDDYLALLAFLCLLANNLIYTILLPVFEVSQNVGYYHHKPPADYKHKEAVFAKAQWGIAFTYITGLWAAKGVFIVCYGKLTEGIKIFRRVWYALVAYVVLTYIGWVIAYPLLNHLSQCERRRWSDLRVLANSSM